MSEFKANINIAIKDHNHSGKVAKHRKERHFLKQYTLLDKEFNELAVFRIYDTQATTYACIWINSSKARIHIGGGAKSSGYGYHRSSDAVQNALNDAGVMLNYDISGRGDGAIKYALEGIARYLKVDDYGIIEAHA